MAEILDSITSFYKPWSHDFISAGLFSKTEEGTGFHSARSFYSVLCSKSKTIMFLAIAQGQVNTVKCVSASLLHFSNQRFMTLFLQGCLAR